MADEIQKYRGRETPDSMESRRFFHYYNLLAKDGRDGKTDPFPYKYAVQPPKQGSI